MDALAETKERLSIFKNLYDYIRLVNPMDTTVINHECESLSVAPGFCYEAWKRNSKCDNCISKIAYEKEETAMKLEYSQGKIIVVIACPLIINEKKYVVEMIKDITTTGVVSNADRNYTEPIVDFLHTVREHTLKDDLTQVYNKTYINERLPQDLKRSVREKKSTSVVMIDLDYFKRINDTYGHVIGDRILKEFAAILKDYVRSDFMDWVGRYGGEEFILVLNNADEQVAFLIAERIRSKVQERVFKYDNIKINITCSLGIYSSKGADIMVDEAIQKADMNLYKAKTLGRNRVIK